MAPTTAYAQAQEDEIEVLRSIYMEDYQEVAIKGAWSKTSDRAFTLKLRASTDNETWVSLSVRFTATYPKTPPLLSVEYADVLQERARNKIGDLIRTKPKAHLGEVVIYEIASSIQDVLEDAVQSREHDAALPSFAEQRMIDEAAAAEATKREEEELARKRLEEQAEEQRALL